MFVFRDEIRVSLKAWINTSQSNKYKTSLAHVCFYVWSEEGPEAVSCLCRVNCQPSVEVKK